jgi:hypothetical protein
MDLPAFGGPDRGSLPADASVPGSRCSRERYFGATAFDGSESRPVPFAFVAATVNV